MYQRRFPDTAPVFHLFLVTAAQANGVTLAGRKRSFDRRKTEPGRTLWHAWRCQCFDGGLCSRMGLANGRLTGIYRSFCRRFQETEDQKEMAITTAPPRPVTISEMVTSDCMNMMIDSPMIA